MVFCGELYPEFVDLSGPIIFMAGQSQDCVPLKSPLGIKRGHASKLLNPCPTPYRFSHCSPVCHSSCVSHCRPICARPQCLGPCYSGCIPQCGSPCRSIYPCSCQCPCPYPYPYPYPCQPQGISSCIPIYGRPQCLNPCRPICVNPCQSPCYPPCGYPRPQVCARPCCLYPQRPYYPYCGYPCGSPCGQLSPCDFLEYYYEF